MKPVQPQFVEKVWGSEILAPWFPNSAQRIGEVWFPAGDLLIKFLFTSQDLSVQVHPDDEYAREHENSRGKTEMWHILRAHPGAQVAAGFKRPLGEESLRASLADGSVMNYLAWYAAHPGDTFFIPAGTVHAIGAGLALCEIQQSSDVTYRLWDYGRPRELHIDRAMDVADGGCYGGATPARQLGPGRALLVESRYFVTEKRHLNAATSLPAGGFAIVLEGSGRIGGQPFRPGTVWDVGRDDYVLEPDEPVILLLTRAADGSPAQ